MNCTVEWSGKSWLKGTRAIEATHVILKAVNGALS
jgi:hypothetical protein